MLSDRPSRAPNAPSALDAGSEPRSSVRPITPGFCRRFTIPCFALAMALLALGGCTLTPAGTAREQAKLDHAGKPYEPKFENRTLPELPDAPIWRDVLRRTFLANGEIEAAYFRWKAAVERIGIAGAYPNSDVSLGFDYRFSGERMTAFDRSTFTAGFDSAMSLSLPVKVERAAKIALDAAQAEGERFRVAKFDLQRTVLHAWADYILQERTIELRSEDIALRRVLVNAAAGGTGAGKRVREAQAADLDLRTAESELLDLRSEHESTRAKLNALMGRGSRDLLRAPSVFPPARSLPDDDTVMLKAAADMFPEVAALAQETEGRADALELARLRWIPDFNPTLGITGTISQAVGAMVTLPTSIPRIRGQIREAEAELRASQAMLRQRSSDRVGEYIGLLVMYRNAQRRVALYERTILPAARRLADDQARAYESGASAFAEVVEGRRVLLGIQELIVASQSVMDKAVVEIECCLGVDIETLPPADESPAMLVPPTSQPSAPTHEEPRHDR
jgi:outer membrane protein TolC